MSRAWMIVGTVIVVAAVAVMVSLGFWQLRRLDERRAINVVRETIRTAEPIRLPDAPPPERRLEHPAVAVGSFEAPEFTILNRGYKGSPGVGIVSTFRLTTGERVLVDRGFVPLQSRNVAPAPPTGPVELRGFLLVDTEDKRTPHPKELPALDWVRIEPAEMGEATGIEFLPYALVVTHNVGDGQFPIARKLPPMDDGPHMSYAIQWFSFSAIFGLGWLFLLSRRRRV